MAKHRTGSENAGGSPQEVSVFVERPTTRGLFKTYTYVTISAD